MRFHCITSFCIASHKTGHMALMLPFRFFFFFTAGIVEQSSVHSFCLMKYLTLNDDYHIL